MMCLPFSIACEGENHCLSWKATLLSDLCTVLYGHYSTLEVKLVSDGDSPVSSFLPPKRDSASHLLCKLHVSRQSAKANACNHS